MHNWKRAVTVILALTATSKIISLFHPGPLLFQGDVVFKVPIHYVVAAAASLEVILCICINFIFTDAISLVSVFVFSNVILAYRALAVSSGKSHCPCLGNVANWWPWLGQNETPVLNTVVIWLFLTSTYQLVSRANTRND
jgi:hypothetical protein